MHSPSLVVSKQPVGRLIFAATLVLLVAAISSVNAQVTVTCPASITVSNDPGVCSAVVDFPDPVVTGTNAGDVVTITPPSGSTFPVGTNEVQVAVMAGTNSLASCSFNITVEDLESPAITNIAASKSILWPPNHKMIKVTINYDATDNCDSAPETSLSVASNESLNGPGDGNTSADWEVIDNHHVWLRAERAGGGSGRSYTITITATDVGGNSTEADVTVLVPHDKGRHNGNGGGNGNGNGHGHGHGK